MMARDGDGNRIIGAQTDPRERIRCRLHWDGSARCVANLRAPPTSLNNPIMSRLASDEDTNAVGGIMHDPPIRQPVLRGDGQEGDWFVGCTIMTRAITPGKSCRRIMACGTPRARFKGIGLAALQNSPVVVGHQSRARLS